MELTVIKNILVSILYKWSLSNNERLKIYFEESEIQQQYDNDDKTITYYTIPLKRIGNYGKFSYSNLQDILERNFNEWAEVELIDSRKIEYKEYNASSLMIRLKVDRVLFSQYYPSSTTTTTITTTTNKKKNLFIIRICQLLWKWILLLILALLLTTFLLNVLSNTLQKTYQNPRQVVV